MAFQKARALTVTGRVDAAKAAALGLAAMTAVAAAFGADRAGDLVSITDGFSAGLLGAAGIAALGALAAAAWLRTSAPTPEQPEQPEHEAVSA